MKLTPKEGKQVAFPRLVAINEEKMALSEYHSENLWGFPVQAWWVFVFSKSAGISYQLSSRIEFWHYYILPYS